MARGAVGGAALGAKLGLFAVIAKFFKSFWKLLLLGVAVVFGFVAFNRLATDLLPDITYPSITVQTEFPDTAPQEVENLVTRPVEEAVGVLRGLQTIHSVSRAGVSEVTLEFEWGSDMDALSMEVREKIDRLILPEGCEDPIILRFDPSLEPVVRLALHGDGPPVTSRRLADGDEIWIEPWRAAAFPVLKDLIVDIVYTSPQGCDIRARVGCLFCVHV